MKGFLADRIRLRRYQRDEWNELSLVSERELAARVEKKTRKIVNMRGEEVLVSAKVYLMPVEVSALMRVYYDGKEYDIEEIRVMRQGNRIHHIELFVR